MVSIHSRPLGRHAAAQSVRHLARSAIGARFTSLRAMGTAATLAGALTLAGCGSASETEPSASAESAAPSIAVTQGWARETAEGQDVGGAFMTIANAGVTADRLTGGWSPVAGEVQVHTVDMAGGVMRMRELADGLEIPAGGSVTLGPGGYHIMLVGLERSLRRGDGVPLTLTFEHAGAVEVELAVEPIGAAGPGHGAGGGHD